MKKKGFTLQQHKAVGARLAKIHDQLQALKAELSAVYPVRFSDAVLKRAINGTVEARSQLEDAMFRERHAEADTAIYFPADRNFSADADLPL